MVSVSVGPDVDSAGAVVRASTAPDTSDGVLHFAAFLAAVLAAALLLLAAGTVTVRHRPTTFVLVEKLTLSLSQLTPMVPFYSLWVNRFAEHLPLETVLKPKNSAQCRRVCFLGTEVEGLDPVPNLRDQSLKS